MNSIIPYLGGKSRLAKTIIERIPEHICYCEPFAGAAWVLFKKPISSSEVINDISSELITLYRVIQNHLEEFIKYFKWALISREEFQRQLKSDPDTLTDIQRAVRYYYLQKCGFGGKGKNFGTATTSAPRMNLLRIEEDLSTAHLRLSRVFIENLNYPDLIKKYDRQHTFFYIDPPYYNCENDYGKGIFKCDDFIYLAEKLGNINGKFIMSINNTEEIRSIYKMFYMEEVKTKYSVSRDNNQDVTELLIKNF